MTKITWEQMVSTFCRFNERNNIRTKGTGKQITGVVVYKESNWEKQYSLESRSYRVSSDNKAFIPGQLGYSIFAGSLDGTDPSVRLERYDWEVDYCYLEYECIDVVSSETGEVLFKAVEAGTDEEGARKWIEENGYTLDYIEEGENFFIPLVPHLSFYVKVKHS